MMKLYSRIDIDLEHYKQNNAFRFLKKESIINTDIINLSSNDYLGIAQSEDLLKEFYSKNKNLTFSSSSSRLLDGNHKFYDKIETQLKNLYQSESALFFNSGYHLNIGVLPSLTSKNDLILADKLVHASIIEAIKLAPAKTIRYKHLDYSQLENILKKSQNTYENIFIVSESIFSMDGDKTDIQKLVDLKNRYGAYLYLDEAHAVGIVGEQGLGLSEETALIPEIDFLVGTMGKAIASVGAYLICKSSIKAYLVNNCKSLIYTTSLPPINIAWSSFIIDKIIKMTVQRNSVKEKARYLKNKLKESNIDALGETHILAILVGENDKCLKLSNYLQKNNIKVQAIRPPTVPKNTARIRISLHANLSFDELDKLAQIIIDYAN